MNPEHPIQGFVNPRFGALARAFSANFAERGEVGASLALMIDGQLVVDLWGGALDGEGTRPWREDSVVNIWSTTKAVNALCFALLVERGLCAYDAPVSRWWPEFAAHGKGEVTLAMLLSHQAGLCSFRDPAVIEDFYDLPTAAARLAATPPLWPPGSRSGYHAISIGVLAGELFRRIEGRSLGRFITEELSAPRGLELSLGLPESEDVRRAEMIAPPEMASSAMQPEMNPSQVAAYTNPVIHPLLPNSAAWRSCELSSANGFSNAGSLARLFGAVAAGGLLSAETLRQATAERIRGVDEVLGVPARWAAGFLLNTDGLYGPAPDAFGHSGWGGSFVMMDLKRRMSLAYAMNRMGTDLVGDPRANALVAAAYEGLIS